MPRCMTARGSAGIAGGGPQKTLLFLEADESWGGWKIYYGFTMVYYGFTIDLLWFYHGFTMVYYGFTMVLLWFYFGFTMVLGMTMG